MQNNDFIPKESETIAAVRSARVLERLRKEKNRTGVSRAWWSEDFIEHFAILGIFLLNLYLVLPFFGTAAPEIPFSSPTIPVLSWTFRVFGLDLSYSIQIVNIVFILLFPLSFYFFIKYVCGRKLIALLSVLFVSLPFYPFAGLRIKSALLGGDGPHIANLAIVPIASLGILKFMRKGGINNLILASTASGIVALTSPFGFITFAMFAVITAFSEMLLGNGRLKVARLVSVFIFVGGLVSFWHNPGFIFWMLTGPMGEEIRQMIGNLIPISFFAIPLCAIIGYLLFDRKPGMQPTFLAIFYFVTFSIISLAGGGVVPSHPSRYTPELGMALAFLISIILVQCGDYIRFHEGIRLYIFKNIEKGKFVNGTLALVGSLLILLILGGRKNISNENVLGIWSGVERGQLWVKKDESGRFPTVTGYAITGSTILSLGFLKAKSMKSKS